MDLLKSVGCCWFMTVCVRCEWGCGYGLLTEKSMNKFEKFPMWSSNLFFADQYKTYNNILKFSKLQKHITFFIRRVSRQNENMIPNGHTKTFHRVCNFRFDG